MAKSTNFFGLRRGSTKSLTFQVYKGTQVTKDRVTDVSNPQTEAQMRQRLKLSMVASTREVLKEIVNHSFEDVEYGEKSLKEFSRINLQANNLNVAEYVPKGITDTGLADFQISRGSLTPMVVYPEAYIKHEGNIYLVEGYQPFALEQQGQITNYQLTADDAKATKLTENLLSKICSALGLGEGEQLTFLLIRDGDYYSLSDTQASLNYHRFVVSRLINDITKVEQWTLDSNLEGDNNILLTDGYINLLVNFDMNLTYISPYNPDYLGQGCAVIHSVKDGDTWKRSTQKIVCAVHEDAAKNASYENCVASYLKTQPTSDKYLNTGAEGVDITGGNS